MSMMISPGLLLEDGTISRCNLNRIRQRQYSTVLLIRSLERSDQQSAGRKSVQLES